ncbi:MAG: tyrosine-type recombinase/integrase [Candidatus Edwardsbacteria bacterium]
MTITDDGKIDIHNSTKNYDRALKSLERDKKIIAENKRLIFAFLKDCETGKTIKNKSKKKIGAKRCNRLLDMLKFISNTINKRFNKLSQEELERFILEFENDRYKKKNKKKFSEATKNYYKIGFRKFGKWMKEKGINNLDFSFMETYEKIKEIPAFTREEIEKMINKTSLVRDKALVMLLFDSGARIEEFLNIRLKHLTKKEDYYMIRIEFSKTNPRTISIPMSTKLLEAWLQEHPDKKNPETQLFPMSYDHVRMTLKRLAKKALNKDIKIHHLRHSSATYYCHKLTPYQLCYRYGWSMASKQPARYIDREGIHEEQTAEIVKTDEVSKIKKENQEIKEDLIRLKEENNNIWKLVEKLNLTSKITYEAINENPEVKKEIVKVIKRMLSNSNIPLSFSLKPA